MGHDMRERSLMKPETQDIAVQVAKASPAVVGTWYANATPNEVVALGVGIATFVYIIVQAAYLVRKWVREETEWGRRMKRKDAPSTLQ